MFVGVTIAPTIAQNTEESQSVSRGNWLYVGGSGPGNYTRIQDALFWAHDGDTIFVYNGIYNEWLLIEVKLSLIGEDKYNTIINGDIKNVADHVTIRGFTIQNAAFSGIYMTPRDVPIRKNVEYVTIHDTIIKDNGKNGIEMSFVVNSEFYNNIIINNTENGISIKGDAEQYGGYIGNNIIHNNTIENNPIGIYLYVESGSNIVQYNDIRSNEIGIELFFHYSVDGISIIQNNNFINNKRSIHRYSWIPVQYVIRDPSLLSPPQETWDNNYWDDWNISLPRPICSLTRIYYHRPDTISVLKDDRIVPLINTLDNRYGYVMFVYLSIFFDRHPAQEPYDIPGVS